MSAMIIPAAAALLVLQLYSVAAQVGVGPPPSCPTSCGNVSVPFPFGISDGCYLPGFNLTCDRTRAPPRLLVGDGTLQVVEVSLANSTVRVINSAGAVNITYEYDGATEGSGTWGGLGAGPYVVSERRNYLIVTGCNVQATLFEDSNVQATLLEGSNVQVISGCSSFCSTFDRAAGRWAGAAAALNSPYDSGGAACSGISCCEATITIGRPSYGVRFKSLDQNMSDVLPIAVLIAERRWFEGVSVEMLKNSLRVAPHQMPVPVVLEWAVASAPVRMPGVADNENSTCPMDAARSACRSSHSSCRNVTGNYRSGYVCRCQDGYQGNPYLTGGCQDIDECALPEKCFGECTNTPGGYVCRCPRGARGNPLIRDGCVKSSLGLSIGLGVGSGAGLLFLVLGATFATRKIKHRRAKMLRQRFFKQNRGHLLQQLVSQKADIAERMVIPLEELEKATNNFDKARELGGGGHGTVYKGILADLHVVAIKKSKVAIQREIDEFINEVAILSQINHRNVVKLFGCCLETEVPLLVYEFISNGTLYHHLHVQGPTSLPWEDRLRIAIETARALAYLHSAVSFPIIHRDIKSQNILLDGALTTKVSDFGASRCIPVDQTGVTTAVQGTLGYLDPMYYYTGRLTEKSDVYSFGVVLIELLTRKKPYSYRSSEDDSLVAHFTALLTEGNLVRILDPQVVQEGGKEVEKVVALAVVCVRLKGEDRPTMRQVEITLESLRESQENVVLRDVGAERSEENHIAQSLARNQGRKRKETSRQYSLEEEYLLSARHPR